MADVRPATQGARVNVKLIITLLIVAFALFIIVTAPQTSATAVHGAVIAIAAAFRSLATFVSSL